MTHIPRKLRFWSAATLTLALTASAAPGLAQSRDFHTHHSVFLAGKASPTQRSSAGTAKRHKHRQKRPLTANNTVLGFAPPPVQAKAAFVIDMQSHRVLFEKNADARLAMASTTKITTAVVTLQHARLGALARVSHHAATVGEATMALSEGERLTVRQLLYGLLLNSANDAAVTLAEHVGGSERSFVAMMNALARALGMRNTHYVTPHGLDEPGHYTSARDLATMALYAMRDATFRHIVSTFSYHIKATRHNSEHWLANINRVMYWFPGVDGVKPGQTDNSGLCQVVSDWRNGHHLLVVLLNTPTLVTDVRSLLNFGAQDFHWIQAPAWWDSPENAQIGGQGSDKWVYYLGGGHYIRGRFLGYFQTHGGLNTLGFPRTEQLHDAGRVVQYFQGGELVFDSVHGTVYPQPVALAAPAAPHGSARRVTFRLSVSALFRPYYDRLGGPGVLGAPSTTLNLGRGGTVQLFQYGALQFANGVFSVLPVGDALLRDRGWLPVHGAADAFSSGMSRSAPGPVLAALAGVAAPVRRSHRRP